MSKSSSVAKKLARPGDPYVTADGRVFHEENIVTPYKDRDGKVDTSAIDFKPSRRRAVKELPAPVKIFNGIACVFVYSMLGVSEFDTAIALGITVDNVKDIKKHAAYRETFDCVVGEFINVNSNLLQARIAAYGQEALTGLANIALNGKAESNVLRANIDLLDRGGHSKKLDAGKSMGMGELRIVILDKQRKVEVDLGDMTNDQSKE
jgi:hypothetical protein